MNRFHSIVMMSAVIVAGAPVAAQQVIPTPDGIFLCRSPHPRCFWAGDPAAYPYYQFGLTPVGQMSGISDYLLPGPALPHYQSFVVEVLSERADTNAVALWGDATSVVDGGRVWGGFLSARSGFINSPSGDRADSQIVGLEIDVLNGGLPGVFPNASKVGLQIVGFGNINTNAIEVLTETPSAAWMNILNIQPNTVAPDGTVIGMTPQNARLGINFEGSRFLDSAMLLSENNRISFRTPGTSDAAIYRDALGNGHLVLQAGPAGLRITNAEDTRNLLVVTPDGDLVTRFGSYAGFVSRLNAVETTQSGIAINNSSNLPAARATGTGSVAVGAGTAATGAQAVASGAGASASGTGSIALGVAAAATGANAVAAGANASATNSGSVALGTTARSTGLESVALGAASDDGGEAGVVSVGSLTQTRRVTNVGPGVRGTDAVNFNQLNTVASGAQAYTDQRFNELRFSLTEVRRDAEASTASAMALAGIPQAPTGKGMLGVGVGVWQGQQAFAVGVSKSVANGRLAFKAGATYNTRHQGGANGGVGFAF